MSYSATVTLTSGTANANVDNFNIDVYDGSGLRSTLATGVSRTDLTNGYTVAGILSTDTFIRVASNSTCVNSVDYFLPGATPTPTPSPVVSSQYSFQVASGTPGQANINGSACYNFQNAVNETLFNMYTSVNTAGFVDGSTYYDVYGNPFNGHGGAFSDGTNYGKINTLGVFTQIDACGTV